MSVSIDVEGVFLLCARVWGILQKRILKGISHFTSIRGHNDEEDVDVDNDV